MRVEPVDTKIVFKKHLKSQPIRDMVDPLPPKDTFGPKQPEGILKVDYMA